MKPARAKKRFAGRRGPPHAMTMVELLIVVAVMVILMGVALPVMKTGIEGRKLREAARQVSVSVELAKGIAAETGLPSAVLIEPQFLPNASEPLGSKLYLAETPLPYSGDVVNAKAYVETDQSAGTSKVTFGYANPLVNPAESLGITTLGVEYGDAIRFDYKGTTYQLQLTQPIAAPTDVIPISGWPLPPTGVYSYQIYRQPQKSGAAPLELPQGTVIDLSASGLGIDNQFSYAAAGRPISLMFGPSGKLIRVKYTRSALPLQADFSPTSTVHFLVGNVENLGIENLSEPAAFWVSIGHSGGRVTTAENGVAMQWLPTHAYSSTGVYCRPSIANSYCYIVVTPGVSGGTEPVWPTTIFNTVNDGSVVWQCRSIMESAREFAQSAKSVGGR